jgi:hypothetical protein
VQAEFQYAGWTPPNEQKKWVFRGPSWRTPELISSDVVRYKYLMDMDGNGWSSRQCRSHLDCDDRLLTTIPLDRQVSVS